MALETGIVMRVMESVEFVREALREHPSLSPLVVELLDGSIKRPIDATPMRSSGTASTAAAPAARKRRKMTAAQLEADESSLEESEEDGEEQSRGLATALAPHPGKRFSGGEDIFS